MRDRSPGRTRPVLLALAACALLAGCDRDRKTTEGPAAKDSGVTTTAGATVIFHMTGLVLLVPDGTSMRVLLPEMAGHVARLGVGFEPGHPPGPPGFCDDSDFPVKPTSKGICYVNLRYWKLNDFGANGTPPLPTGVLPPGVLNATDHWQYRAPLPADSVKLRGQLTLLAGAPGQPCSLARWKFKPFVESGGQHPESNEELVNVLRWTITNASPELVFLPRAGGGPPVRVTLPRPTGTNELVLAHIPGGKLRELPPQVSGAGSGRRDLAVEFDAYFNLLERPTPLPAGHRRIPYNGAPIAGRTCPVSVSLPGGLAPSKLSASPRTFSCMVATAQPL
jgi:hypothetical protein